MLENADLSKALAEFCPDPNNKPELTSDFDLESIKIHLEELDRKRAAFLVVQEGIEAKVKTEDVPATLEEHSILESKYIRVKAAVR